jgi:hypothetical protein
LNQNHARALFSWELDLGCLSNIISIALKESEEPERTEIIKNAVLKIERVEERIKQKRINWAEFSVMVTEEEVAKILGCDIDTLQKIITSDMLFPIPYEIGEMKLKRFKRYEVEEYIESWCPAKEQKERWLKHYFENNAYRLRIPCDLYKRFSDEAAVKGLTVDALLIEILTEQASPQGSA